MQKKTETLVGLRRGIELLEILARSKEGLSFNELKKKLPGVSPSVLSRLVKTLLEEKIIILNPENRFYQPADRVKILAEALMGKLSTAAIVQPMLDRLAEKTGCSSAFFEFDINAVVLVAKSEPAEAFHYMSVGRSNNNFDCHGFAKACLAYLPDKIKSSLIKNMEHIQDNGKAKFLLEIDRIKKQKFLVNLNDDQDGIFRITAPVFAGIKLKFAGIIGISGFGKLSKIKIRMLTEAVTKSADQASSNFS